MYRYCDLCFTFFAKCAAQTRKPLFTNNSSKYSVWCKVHFFNDMFFSTYTFSGSFCRKTPILFPQNRQSQTKCTRLPPMSHATLAMKLWYLAYFQIDFKTDYTVNLELKEDKLWPQTIVSGKNKSKIFPINSGSRNQ